MFGVADAAGVGAAAAAFAVVSADWVSDFAQPANMTDAAIPAAATAKGFLENRLIEKGSSY
jgi:hypothetical protein